MIRALLVLTVSLALSSPASASFSKVPTETGNFCRDQAMGHLRYLFGEEVEFGKIFSAQGGDDTSLWIKNSLCDGYFVASFNKNASCTSAHYGFAPVYVNRIWAFGSCKALLPRDSYPRNETTLPFIRAKLVK